MQVMLSSQKRVREAQLSEAKEKVASLEEELQHLRAQHDALHAQHAQQTSAQQAEFDRHLQELKVRAYLHG